MQANVKVILERLISYLSYIGVAEWIFQNCAYFLYLNTLMDPSENDLQHGYWWHMLMWRRSCLSNLNKCGVPSCYKCRNKLKATNTCLVLLFWCRLEILWFRAMTGFTQRIMIYIRTHRSHSSVNRLYMSSSGGQVWIIWKMCMIDALLLTFTCLMILW